MSMFRRVGIMVPAILMVLAAAQLSAQTMGPKSMFRGAQRDNYLPQAMQELLNQTGDRPLADLTGAEIRKALGDLSVAQQEQAYVRRSAMASLFVPGAGQFMNHAPQSGALFLAGDIVVAAGSVVGAYFLLPSDLQFGSTNYFADDFSTIKNSWLNHSFLDYLPSAAVAAGGMLVDHLLRHLSAENAANLARANIKDKKVTFQPEPFLLLRGPRGPMMGFGMGMRF